MTRTPRAYSEESPLPHHEIPFFFDESELVEDGIILKFCHPDTDLMGHVKYVLGRTKIEVEFDTPTSFDRSMERFVVGHLPKDFHENVERLRFCDGRPSSSWVRPGFDAVRRYKDCIIAEFHDEETYLSGILTFNVRTQEYSGDYTWRDEPPECHPGHEYPELDALEPEHIEWLLSVAPEAFKSLIAEATSKQDQVPASIRP
jgi:hypothetical protein